MATTTDTLVVRLFDEREPDEAGKEILEDALDGRDITATPEALRFALEWAGEAIGSAWKGLAEIMSAYPGDVVVQRGINEARWEIERLTGIADAFSRVLEGYVGCEEGD